MVRSLQKEILLQRYYLQNEIVNTIYFGGGTPSILNGNEIGILLLEIQNNFNVKNDAEITLEANPDDLDFNKIRNFKKAGINRLSIGIQSFYDEHLRFLNRVHSSEEAIKSVKIAQDEGFSNISIDLIYGIPYKDHSIWEHDLNQALELNPQHISSYCLTIEEKTAFGSWLKKGKLKPVEEEFAAVQFEILANQLTKNNFEHYEISNFALPGFRSRHNGNYWRYEKYLGIGPGAHSFDGISRQSNIANNVKYIKSLKEEIIPADIEILTQEDQINEYILTSLRTSDGCSLEKLITVFQYDILKEKKDYIRSLVLEEYITLSSENIVLTGSGKLLADKIAEDLFI
jgi:oxygen-independent coproporphyrinogen III oxidase